jgi:hypothetical protein
VLNSFVQIADSSEFNYGEAGTNSPFQDTETYEAVQCLFPNMITTYDKLLDIEENIIDHTYVNGAKFAGCDGWNQDEDNEADNCEEDDYPPEIVLPVNVVEIERVATSDERSEDKIRIVGRFFTSNEGRLLIT